MSEAAHAAGKRLEQESDSSEYGEGDRSGQGSEAGVRDSSERGEASEGEAEETRAVSRRGEGLRRWRESAAERKITDPAWPPRGVSKEGIEVPWAHLKTPARLAPNMMPQASVVSMGPVKVYKGHFDSTPCLIVIQKGLSPCVVPWENVAAVGIKS